MQYNNSGNCRFGNATLYDELSVAFTDGKMSHPLSFMCTDISDKWALTTLVAEEIYPQSTNNFTKWLSSPGYFTFDYPNKPYGVVGESAHSLIHAANLTFVAPQDNNFDIFEYRVTWVNVHKVYDTGTQSLVGNPPSTDSVVIYNLTNGQQYTFSIEARNKQGYGRASEATAVVDIVPGQFSRVAMNFTSDVAGTYTNVKLAFETANRVPGNGVVMVTLPEKFPRIDYASVLDAAVVVDAGSAQAGTTVTAVSRNITVYLSEAISKGSSVVLTLKNVRLMPTSIHTGRLPRLATGDVRAAPIDEASEAYHSSVRPFGVKIRPGSFAKAPRVTYASDAAGDVPEWVNISFRTYNEWPVDGALRVEFPPTFSNLSRWESSIVTPCCSSMVATVDGMHVYLRRNASSTLGTIAGQTEVVVMASGIELPPYSGHTGDFVSFRTETANASVVIDEASANEHANRLPAGLLVVPGDFTVRPRLNLSNTYAGERGTVDVSFETTNPLPADGRILVTLPGTFLDIPNPGATLTLRAVYPHGATADELVLYNHTDDLNVTLTRRGTATGAAAFPQHTFLSFSIGAVKNMPYQGSSGVVPMVRTELASGVPIDEASSGHYAHRRAPGTVITPGRFRSRPTVTLAKYLAGARTEMYLNVTVFNPIPVDGLINLMLPGGSAMDFTDVGSNANAEAYAMSGIDGSVALTFSRQATVSKWTSYGVFNTWNLTVTRGGDGTVTAQGSNISLRITGITNPEEVGTTADYPIVRTVLADGTTSIDEASFNYNSEGMAAGTAIEPGTIRQATFGSEFQVVGGVGYVDVKFEIDNPIPNNGLIFLQFPTNYTLPSECVAIDRNGSIDAATASWTVSTSTTKSHLNLTLQGDGSSSIPAESRIDVRFYGIFNPTTVDPAVVFPTIRTINGNRRTVDETSATFHSEYRPGTPAIRRGEHPASAHRQSLLEETNGQRKENWQPPYSPTLHTPL